MKGKGELYWYFFEQSNSIQELVNKRDGNRFKKKNPTLSPIPEEEPNNPPALNPDNQSDTLLGGSFPIH